MLQTRLGCLVVSSLILISPLYASNKTMTSQISTYAQLVSAVEAGDDVVGIVQFDKCQVEGPSSRVKNTPFDAPKASTRINFTIFSHYDVQVGETLKNTVATSMTILTNSEQLGTNYAYGRLRVFDDGSAQFHATYYDPVSYQVKASGDWDCQIGNGVTLLDKDAWF